MDRKQAQKAYATGSIVYSTSPQLAFDYIRDSREITLGALALPDLGFAIVDEADLALVDQASDSFILAERDEPILNHERVISSVAVAKGLLVMQLQAASIGYTRPWCSDASQALMNALCNVDVVPEICKETVARLLFYAKEAGLPLKQGKW